MEQVYLEYLKLYLIHDDQDGHLFRTFVDNWFAYSHGGHMLNSKGRPKWFNNPDPKKERDALLSMHFVSADARKVLSGESNGRLVKDHAIPINILRQLIHDIPEHSVSSIGAFLMNNYRLGVITKAEDDQLNSEKLRSVMPKDWDGLNWKARYDMAVIFE